MLTQSASFHFFKFCFIFIVFCPWVFSLVIVFSMFVVVMVSHLNEQTLNENGPQTLVGYHVLLFTYNTEYHNVMQVTHPQYQNCNATAPLKTFTTGNDSITITRNGHYYYLCGFTGHCQAGQKVDIRVARLTTDSASTPAASPSTAPATTSPPPSKNSASIPSIGVLGKSFVLALTIIAAFGF
ncbi:hypothetical protein MKW94_011771 [Papaver nudicaule]|uniref:Phytocyanin domain-containing protein n=1 Tax=Papaver nudicaule TaxID=74823 RepID=A0AA41VYM7_PAPNU|nr:hypothetical protein [Papaver nudicaule]MCL7049833.1 hypothetical protein [Papaver nudicaule]